MRYSSKKYAAALYESTRGKSKNEQEKIMSSFLLLLERYNDRSLLPKVIEQYERLRRKREGLTKISLTTAKKASAKVLKDIEKKFTGEVEIDEKVDGAVLGGVKLVINDEYLIDGTFQGQVEKIYKALMASADR